MPKSVAEKLLVRADAPLVLVGPQDPADRPSLGLPGESGAAGVDVAAADVVLAFVADRADLDRTLAELLPVASGVRAVWLAYRKGNVVDINRDTIAAAVTASGPPGAGHDSTRQRRGVRAPEGWRPVTQIALDDAWSALRVRPL